MVFLIETFTSSGFKKLVLFIPLMAGKKLGPGFYLIVLDADRVASCFGAVLSARVLPIFSTLFWKRASGEGGL